MALNKSLRQALVAGTAVVIAGSALLADLRQDEGTRYRPYRDIGGVWTVCQGHTGPDIDISKTYTEADCDALLIKNTERHGKAVLRCTKVPLNQNQYDAFTRFAFNVGPSAFCNSTLVKKLNAGDYGGACRQLLRWDRICTKRDKLGKCLETRAIKGLANRRQSEYRQCITPVSPPTRTPLNQREVA